MRLLYLANNRIPSEKANSLQIMQMCDAFKAEGVGVRLVVPRRIQPRAMRSVQDPFQYYGLNERFPIVHLPCADALELAPSALQPAAFAAQSYSFALSVAVYLSSARADVYYARDPLSTLLLAAAPGRIRRRAVYEAHTFPASPGSRRLHLWAARRIGRIVCITRGLAEEYLSRGIPGSRILVAPDAVDLSRFRSMPSREEARRRLGIPNDLVIACYAGHLYDWKGAHTLAEASKLLPSGYLVHLVGGTVEDLAAFRRFLAERRLARVNLAGWVPPGEVMQHLAAADVLVLPNSGADLRSSRYTSPMKLFEYMAARRPIVASRLPSLQEILCHEENALLVEPDNPVALAEGIFTVISSGPLAKAIADRAWEEVLAHTWKARSKRILDFIGD